MFYVKNVPGRERAVRIAIGMVVAVLALVSIKGIAGVVVAVLAAGLVVSGLVGFCPACAMVGRRLDKSLKSKG
ncbi:hypothetical protein GQ57_16860 [Burkholderia sp. MSh2]|uniref:Inner membrane protein YgaP-like transmembrane domain-containing protein n=1 Tax=Burkholderia paludis TaxID=1506587 RepID=A0A6J5ENM6_9BURK|nr:MULTISPECIES: DUF2892 domain-containing protein [Burkholderia]KEZ04747.1 hypothetical protein GQ57_16860 [Burkholderia sp. MSh2]KFG94327.1 hypothetical protein GQ56_0126690 [Burkholderia paludis]CAB3767454.1 hypothetical protein LMG30113_05484 [Burkholderia paludis]VWC45822.1 hypothetical protein BPA30113_07294 [Burkholderia paludis]